MMHRSFARRLARVFVPALVAGMLFAAQAGAATTLSLAKVQALVASASHGRAQAQSVFAGPGGLTGAVITYKDQPDAAPSVIWINNDASALLVGKLIGSHGQDLNKQAAQQVGLLLTPAKGLAAAAQPDAAAIHSGRSGPVLTVFIDPNCIYCHMLYQKLQPLIAQGKLRVRYVVVAVVKQSSLDRAAAILEARDPVAALAEDQKDFDVKTEEGGIKRARTPSAAMVTRIGNNNALLDKLGSQGTPTLLYCSKDGQVEQLDGMPSDFDALMAELASGPERACNTL